MDNPKLLRDHAGDPVQGVMSVKSNRRTNFSAASGTARVSGETAIARVVTTVNCYMAFGGATVEATAQDILLIAGKPELFALSEGSEYMAFKGSGEVGWAHVSCLR